MAEGTDDDHEESLHRIYGATQKPGSKYNGCSCHCPTPDTALEVNFFVEDTQNKRVYIDSLVVESGSVTELGVIYSWDSIKYYRGTGQVNVAVTEGRILSGRLDVWPNSLINRLYDSLELTGFANAKIELLPPDEGDHIWGRGGLRYIAPNHSTVDTVYVAALIREDRIGDTTIWNNCEIQKWNYYKLPITILPPSNVNDAAKDVQVLLYPQPFRDRFTASTSGIEGKTDFVVYDVLGRVCLFITKHLSKGEQVPFDVKLIPGRYYLQVTNGSYTKMLPLIRE